jgi:hypothetical protein
MKKQPLSLVFAALALTAAATASAQVRISVGGFFGDYSPPVVYQPAPYYPPPPVVYGGRGYWGDRQGRQEIAHRDRGHERDHQDRGHEDRGREH